MKRRYLLVASLVVASWLTWTVAPPARACSCAPHPTEELYVFDGTARAPVAGAETGEVYEFSSTRAVQKEVPDVVRVVVSVGDSGNCGFPEAPRPEVRYRVVASMGRDAAGGPLLYANTCGGSLTEKPAPRSLAPPAQPASGRGARPAAVAVAAGTTLLILALVLRIRRSRRRRASGAAEPIRPVSDCVRAG